MNADVLVVGAGIAGLTTAAHLLARGFTVTVVEQAPQLRAAGAGIMLHPNALVHLDYLGADLPTTGAYVARQLSIDSSGATTVVNWADVWPDNALPLAIHRRRLAQMLLDRLPKHTVSWSVRPRELLEDETGVTVCFDNAATGRYRLVIGADGVHSWVRQFVDPVAKVRHLGQTYWRTTVHASAPFDFPEWCVWRGNGHFFGAMPIGCGRMHVFLQAALPESTPEQMLALTQSMGGQVADLASALQLAEEPHVRPALGLSATRWALGRVAILGDAAHSLTPASTQGGAMAIEDAAVLADEVAKHGPEPTALQAFGMRRSARVREFTRLSRLHLAVMETIQFQPVAKSNQGDPAAWFRRLYRPLMVAA